VYNTFKRDLQALHLAPRRRHAVRGAAVSAAVLLRSLSYVAVDPLPTSIAAVVAWFADRQTQSTSVVYPVVKVVL